MRILFLTNFPAPYVVHFLDELAKRHDITAVFEASYASHRDASWSLEGETPSFKTVFLNRKGTIKRWSVHPSALRYMSASKFDRIIIADPTSLTGIMCLLYCRWFHIPYILQSEGGFQGSGIGMKERLKRYAMEKASLYLSGMSGDNDYFYTYGATEDRIINYPFSSLYQSEIDRSVVSDDEKESLRKMLNMEDKTVVLAVGRFIPVKGFDTLLNAAAKCREEATFYFVGGTPTEEYLSIVKSNSLDNVHFVPHVSSKELKGYYHAADVLAMPSRGDTWGLVINEAMSNGLPVISSDRCIAGLELVEDGENGLIFSVDDADELAEKILYLHANPETRKRMAKKCIDLIQRFSYENMAEEISCALQ